MKKCTHCGMLYDGDETVCIVDGNPVVDSGERSFNRGTFRPLSGKGPAEPKPFTGHLPSRYKKPRVCSCGGHLAVKSWERWHTKGQLQNDALGYELNYECKNCGRRVTIPTTGFCVRFGLISILSLLPFLIGICVVSAGTKINLGSAIGFGVSGIVGGGCFYFVARKICRGVKNRRKFPIIPD